MPIELSLVMDADLSREALQDISVELTEVLRNIEGIQATPATRAAGEVERSGTVALIGHLVLSIVGRDVLKPLAMGLAAMLRRDKTLVLKLKNKQGRTVEVTSKNLTGDDLRGMVEALGPLISDA